MRYTAIAFSDHPCTCVFRRMLALTLFSSLSAACDRADRSRSDVDRATDPRGAAAASLGTHSLQELRVTVRNGALTAPETLTAGWTRFEVREPAGEGHIVVLFRLLGAETGADQGALMTALDGAATPDGAVALGGPEVGDSGAVVVEMTPGRYLIGCLSRADDGHRHAIRGEARVLTVTGGAATAARGEPPAATQEVRMADFAYVGPDTWAPGAHLLAVRNDGKQDHQLRLARLREGATLRDWMEAANPRDVARDVAGVARLGAGRVAYLAVDLTAGEYVAYCLIPDPGSGRRHVMLGMFRAIHVVGGSGAGG